MLQDYMTKLSFLTVWVRSQHGVRYLMSAPAKGAFQSRSIRSVENDQSEPHPMPEWLPESRPGRLIIITNPVA